jgi:hypothetical protein
LVNIQEPGNLAAMAAESVAIPHGWEAFFSEVFFLQDKRIRQMLNDKRTVLITYFSH